MSGSRPSIDVKQAATRPPLPSVGGWTYWLLLGTFLLAALVRVGLAPRSSLWSDEIFSLAISTGHSLEHPPTSANPALGDFVEPEHPVNANELRRLLRHDDPPAGVARVVRAVFLSDTSPPFYYLLLYAWTRLLGTSDVILRLFSILCSLACLPLLAAVARRIGGQSAVVPACLLFALSPLGVYFSTEGRMYSLLWLCVLGTAWVSLLLQQERSGWLLYASWVGTSALGFLTHYFFLWPWLAMVAFLLLSPGNFPRRRLLACILVCGLAILPWYLFVPDSFSRWRITQGWLHLRSADFERGRATLNHFLHFFSGGFSVFWPGGQRSTPLALACFAAAGVAMAWRLRWRMFTGGRLLLWMWLIAACLAPTVMDLLQGTYSAHHSRYSLAALPAAYLLAAIGLACLGRWLGPALLLFIALSWIRPLQKMYQKDDRNWQPFRRAAEFASAQANSSDLILVHSIPSGVLGLARYANPDGPPFASWVQQLGTRRAPESVHSLAAGRSRVFLVKIHDVGAPAPEEDWLRANAVVFQEVDLDPGRLVGFQPKDSPTFDWLPNSEAAMTPNAP